MTRISDASIANLSATDVTNEANIRFITADIQAATPGTSKDIGLDQIRLAVQSQILTATSHGRTSGDVGKPLFGSAVYDDTSGSQKPHWVLVQSIDANTLRVMPAGGVVDIPVALLDGGNAYNIGSSGRDVYWDLSAGIYKATKPNDSHASATPVLRILSVGASTFRANVHSFAGDIVATNIRALAWPNAILIIRNGAIVYDGTNATPGTAGDNFKTALGNLQSGDTLICGPGTLELVDAQITTSNVQVYGFGTTLKVDDNYSYILSITGSNVLVDGFNLVGTRVSNTGAGWGFSVTGDDVILRNNTTTGCIGSTIGQGAGVYAWQSENNYVERFQLLNHVDRNSYYSGIILTNHLECLIDNVQVIEPKNRAMTIRLGGLSSTMVTNKMTINNFFSLVTTDSGQESAHAGINCDANGFLDQLECNNVHIKMTLDPNDDFNRILFKVQGVHKLKLNNCTVEHPANSGDGETFSFRTQPGEQLLRELRFFNCDFYGTIALEDSIVPELLIIDNCNFGVSHVEFGVNIWELAAQRVKITNSTFNCHSSTKAFDAPATFDLSWEWDIHDNLFMGNSASDQYIINGSGIFASAAGRIRCYNNKLVNNGAGGYYITNSDEDSLVWSTNANGDLLFDADIIGSGINTHTAPGAGPNYFTSMGASKEGTIIWNIRKLSTGSSYPVAWMADGTSWKQLIA